ncbi:hypothetical protein Moror_1891 [Moniliophthora roreri MCA 2997]|uniref:Uncharacterized protein n=1 Tax=Moniliophthora roreri (strain MCA 2997) TaxID=1381753 RepID=V2Y7N9_MONRO|nr:hypothetical protein Moror_1891 [Moniliophthora roreri MCA 2997]
MVITHTFVLTAPGLLALATASPIPGAVNHVGQVPEGLQKAHRGNNAVDACSNGWTVTGGTVSTQTTAKLPANTPAVF